MVDFRGSAVTTNLGGREGGRGIVGGESANVGILGGAAGDKPDGSGVTEKGVGRGHAPNPEFGDEVRGHEEFGFFQGGGVGKEGGGVAVIADAEKDEIEAGGVAQVGADTLFVIAGPDLGGANLAADALDVDPGAVEGLLDHAVVAVLVVGRDPAFIAEVEVGGGPGPLQGGQFLVKGFGGGAPGQGDIESSPGLEGGAAEGFPAGDHGIEPGLGMGKFMQGHQGKRAKKIVKKRWAIPRVGLVGIGGSG